MKPSKSHIRLKKEVSQLLNHVEQSSKPNHCIICGKKNVTICNSHIVPQFILKRIADEGMVCYGQSLFDKQNDFIQTKKGVRNAFTFRLICRDCDKTQFSSYENPDAIINFEKFSNNKKNNFLIEMALKTHLAHIYSKAKSLNLRDSLCHEGLQTIHRLGLPTAEEIDIQEHFQYVDSLNKSRKSTSFTFEILYNELLDYEVGLATQTIIAYQYDLTGKQIFDRHNFVTTNLTKYFYLMILPYNGKTRVMFYIERKYKNLVAPIIEQFNELNEEEKLHFLFISLMIYDEQFYINPVLQQKFRKDKKLVKLYTETDMSCISGDACKKIKDFRKYKNYLTPIN